jgi:Protein of unknown function (DUF2628)
MITFTVHEPPDAPGDRLDRAESLVFVKDGFSWFAAAFGPFWMAANRLWLVLIGYLVLTGALQGLFWSLGWDQRPLSIVMAGLGLLVGLEADTLRRWTLQRHGWQMIGSVNGRNSEDCERRFFDNWLPTQPYVQAKSLSQSTLASGPERVPFASKPETPPATPTSGWRSAFNLRRRGSQ